MLQQNKTNKQTIIFSAKNKYSISEREPNFTKSKEKVRFGQLFFENNPLVRRAEKAGIKQKVLSFQEVGQKRKLVIKIEFTIPYPSFTLQTA